MTDYELKHHLETIEEELKKSNKDKFLENVYDGVIIGVVAGILQALILKLFGL